MINLVIDFNCNLFNLDIYFGVYCKISHAFVNIHIIIVLIVKERRERERENDDHFLY